MSRGKNQNVEVKCTKCGKKFIKMVYGSNDISSFSFPVYKIQRYRDYTSLPSEIELCTDCCDKLDRFLLIREEGQDFYRDVE